MTKFKKLSTCGDSPIVDRRAVLDVLAGDRNALMRGLYWNGTVQGAFHWSQVFEGQKKLSKRSRRYLNKLLSA